MLKVGDRVIYRNDGIVPERCGVMGTVTRVGNIDWDNGETGWTYNPNRAPYYVDLIESPKPSALPEDSAARKEYPLMRGLFDYFPSALAAVAHHSFKGNEKHNPGEEIHHARGKSPDHLDAALRHIMERDLEGAAWRILAALQQKYEDEGHPVAPGARFPDAK